MFDSLDLSSAESRRCLFYRSFGVQRVQTMACTSTTSTRDNYQRSLFAFHELFYFEYILSFYRACKCVTIHGETPRDWN